MDDISSRLSAIIGDRYAFQRELGRGGMATVFLATDIKHDRAVAIKVLHPDLSASIGGERFEREIRVAGRLQHPHILGMYDSGVADGLLYYVMPFVEGESVRDRIDREGQLPIEDALQIALEVADALSHAHGQQIIHRDIKPENILLSGGHALVADFGIASAVEERTQKLTQTGMALGTPAYMAPEQGMGEAVGASADVYSLGCVLFEMLAGEPPFTGKNGAAILAKHVMEQVPSVRIIRQSVPEEVEFAIFSAMGKSPADRPQDCTAFAELLAAAPSEHTSTRLMTMRHTTARRTAGGQTNAFPIARAGTGPWWRRPIVLALAAVLLVGSALGVWRISRGGTAASLADLGGLDRRDLAVLYFDDFSPGGQLEGLADGLTESLIRTLGMVRELQVVSRGGVEPFRHVEGLSSDSIARVLQVGTLVRGSVELEGDKVKVTVRLIDGNSGADLGDRPRVLTLPAGDLTAIVDSTADEVGSLIRTVIGDEIRIRRQQQGTNDRDAWLALQQAERLRRNAASVALEQAEPMFSRADSLLAIAESRDPRWADAPTLRAWVAYDEARKYGLDPIAARAPIDRGLGHADRALAIDSLHPDALEARGTLRYWKYLLGIGATQDSLDGLLVSARADLEAAVRVNPTQAGALASLSHLYTRVTDATDYQSYEAARNAYEADAYLGNAETVLARLFLGAYDLREWQQAERWCSQLQQRFPANYQAPRCGLFMQTTPWITSPDPQLAWRLADSTTALSVAARQEFMRLNSDLLVAAVLARAELGDSARAVVARSRADGELDPSADLAQFSAFVFVLLQDTTAAIDELRRYLVSSPERADGLGWWFEPIEGTAAFRALVGSPD